MPAPQSQRALARRAAPSARHRWPEGLRLRTGGTHAGVAVLAMSVLGLGIAGLSLSSSAAPRTSAKSSNPTVVTTVSPGVEQPSALSRDEGTISRSNFREALTGADKARQKLLTSESTAVVERAEELQQKKQKNERKKKEAAADKAAEKAAAKAAEKDAAEKEEAERKEAEKAEIFGTATLPMKSYRLAARFGDVGAWARYHTGFDFSGPIGTPVYAPDAGVVTTAGSGKASGWAGTYVVVEHADGTQSLYAHLSSVAVQEGQRVAGGDRLGRVGQTGRSFGPHLHFEVYPADAEPGDVYQAEDPELWLNGLGLKP